MLNGSDGVHIFYNKWGPKNPQPVVFHKAGLCRLTTGTRSWYFFWLGAIALLRMTRSHGRSTQVGTGHDMEHPPRANWAARFFTRRL